MAKRQVVIVGGGIGGLCCGIRLLHAGYSVSIYEKEKEAGGVAKSLNLSGLPHDSFASIGVHPEEYQKVFTESGLDWQDYFSEIRLDNLYQIFYQDGSTFMLRHDLAQNKEAMESFYKEPFEYYLHFTEKFYHKYNLASVHLLAKSFTRLSDILSSDTLLATLKLNPFPSASFAIKHIVTNPKLQALLLFQTFYMGLPPNKLSQLYATVPASTQVSGLVHIKGGMGTYVKALEKAFNDLGGQLYFSEPVKRILVQQGCACGIVTSKQIKYCDLVISDADYSYTKAELLQQDEGWSLKKYLNQTYLGSCMTCSVFMLRLNLSVKLPMLSTHNLYLPENLEQCLNDAIKGTIPDFPPVYIYYPSAVDDYFTNDQLVSLNLMVRVPNLSFSKIQWTSDLIYRLRQICLDTLARVTHMPHISQHICGESISIPSDLQRNFHCHYGAAFGLAPVWWQSVWFRPQPVYQPVRNLYFAGSSIHPGNGISIVMKGAKLTSEAVIRNMS